MQCPRCGFENREDARFCKRCGHGFQSAPAPAPKLCAFCGATLKPDARFCARCGQPLGEQAVPAFTPPVGPVSPAPPRHGERPAMPPTVQPPGYGVPAATIPQSTPELPVVPASGLSPNVGSPERGARGGLGWILALVAFGLMLCMSCCGVLVLAILPSLGDETPPAITGDSAGHDISIWVRESYLNKNLTSILPNQGLKDASLDIQPDNRLVATATLDMVFVSPRLEVVTRIAVVNGEIEIRVEDITTGGQNLMSFLGMSDITLGENFTRALKEQLENELGEGSQLLDILTDDKHIILRARL